MYHSDGVVELACGHDRRPGVPRLGQLGTRLRHRHVRVQSEHRGAWHHYVPQRTFVDLQRTGDDGALLGGQAPVAGDQLPQFLEGQLFAPAMRVAAEHADHHIGRLAQQPHDGPGDRRKSAER